MSSLRSGSTTTTEIGYLNRNSQRVLGTRGMAGTDHAQYSYKLVCEVNDCGEAYGANGSDLFQRKCPKCQGGLPGIEY